MTSLRERLESHPIKNLKAEIRKVRKDIKVSGKKKAELVEIMVKFKKDFDYIKKFEKSAPAPKKGKAPEHLKKFQFKKTGRTAEDIEKGKAPAKAKAPAKKKPAGGKSANFSDLEKVKIMRYYEGSQKIPNGGIAYIDNKSGAVYDSKKDFEEDEIVGYIVTIKRPGLSDMKGILMIYTNAPSELYGKDFDLSYGYDYNRVDFKSYSVKKRGFKKIPALPDSRLK
jgi:hypothetical protein